MRSILTILIILTLVSSVLADDWDTMDKSLLGVLIVSKTIDCFQTQYIFDNPEWHELNPYIVDGVDRFGKGFIPIYFVATTLATAFIADWLPSNYRKVWQGIWVESSVTTIHRNYTIGIKLGF